MKLIAKSISITLAIALSIFAVPTATAIKNGEPAAGSDLVVGLVFNSLDNQRGCSGAAVAPRVVFTAAHCLYREPGNSDSKSGPLPVTAGFWVSDPGVEIPAGAKKLTRVIAQFRDERFVNSGRTAEGGHGPLYDFAVLILEAPITTKTFDYVKLPELSGLLKSETKVLAIGYGTKSPTDVGQNTDPKPTQISATLRVENVVQGPIYQRIMDQHPGMILQTKLPANVFMGGGDSGSPLWVQQGSSWMYLGAMCCSNGIHAATPESSPLWKDPFWSVNSHGEYYAAAFFEPVIKTALDYLAGAPVNQPGPNIPVNQPETKPIAKPAKKTIVCVKGAVKRKVTAVKPKCPTGFKKLK